MEKSFEHDYYSIEFSVDPMIQRIFNFQPSAKQDQSFELHSRGVTVKWHLKMTFER